ncbi:uncharacterized protein LOC116610935 [Nematostella vectensis]|uniref:uncharacterized protein LOC116610935 n=1 Tax=Nematostella vectensis TaxID=45351 RepID=UPI0020770D3B|nr:uncharacterized protein LOC116610935 [Nematostella vectensis]
MDVKSMEWSEVSYSIVDLLAKHSLPCVVKVSEGYYDTSNETTISTDEVLVLHRTNTARYFVATTEHCSDLLIPTHLETNVQIEERIVPKVFNSVKRIAEIKPDFIVAKHDQPWLKVQKDEVLRVRETVKDRAGEHLRCTLRNDESREVNIPLSYQADFESYEEARIMMLSELESRTSFPLKVKFIDETIKINLDGIIEGKKEFKLADLGRVTLKEIISKTSVLVSDIKGSRESVMRIPMEISITLEVGKTGVTTRYLDGLLRDVKDWVDNDNIRINNEDATVEKIYEDLESGDEEHEYFEVAPARPPRNTQQTARNSEESEEESENDYEEYDAEDEVFDSQSQSLPMAPTVRPTAPQRGKSESNLSVKSKLEAHGISLPGLSFLRRKKAPPIPPRRPIREAVGQHDQKPPPCPPKPLSLSDTSTLRHNSQTSPTFIRHDSEAPPIPVRKTSEIPQTKTHGPSLVKELSESFSSVFCKHTPPPERTTDTKTFGGTPSDEKQRESPATRVSEMSPKPARPPSDYTTTTPRYVFETKVREDKETVEDKPASNITQAPPDAIQARQLSLPDKLQNLSVPEVAECLEALNMPQYSSNFLDQQIDGRVLVELTEDMLKDSLGMTDKLHRMKLIKFINGWRPIYDSFR